MAYLHLVIMFFTHSISYGRNEVTSTGGHTDKHAFPFVQLFRGGSLFSPTPVWR